MSPMNNRLLVPRSTTRGLLDLVPGAAAAYSLRSLKDSYTSPVVTVRRSSDNAEDDFTATEVSDGTLAAFCGAGDGFVKQWWDQSGNARHASQTTTTYQPKIVSSGVVILEDGKPALQFDGTSDHVDIASSTLLHAADFSVFIVAKPSDTTTPRILITGGTNYFGEARYLFFGSGYMAIGYNGFNSGTSLSQVAGGSHVALSYIATNQATGLAANTQTQANAVGGYSYTTTSAITPTSAGPFSIGWQSHSANQWYVGTIQEVLIYQSDKTASRDLITGNQMWSY